MIFSEGINVEPAISSDVNETDKSSPTKKHPMDIKERKRLAKRILKSVQSQLENAVKVEAEVSSQPVEPALKELERLLEASIQTQPESTISVVNGEVGSTVTINTEVEMTTDDHIDANGSLSMNDNVTESADAEANKDSVDVDVDMEDIDAPHELDTDVVIVATEPSEDTITAALAEVNGNISPAKNGHINGAKDEATPPATNGVNSASQSEQLGPPTPPVSNGDLSNDQGVKVLTDGGIPQFLLKDFNINGTKVTELPGSFTSSSSQPNELGDIDDEELNGIPSSINEPDKAVATGAVRSPLKARKGKGKKRRTASKLR